MKFFLLSLLVAVSVLPANGQYTTNGSATRDNCHCYTLTPNSGTNSGSVWNNNKIDLSQSFHFTFDVFFGCTDANGADGIAFVLQPISTSVGGSGNGMGFGNISPAVGVTLDTYQNSSPDNDPSYDHVAIQLNGDVNHASPNTLTPLTPISATNNNVEDCAWHVLRIDWDAPTKTLSVQFDGQNRISATRDLVNTVFSGNNFVYWGFTGATGGLWNLQQFCTSLTPSFHLLPDQKRCVGEPISFYDSTITFGGILKRYWNFGDGSPIDSVNTNPVHVYTTAGDYSVSLQVIGIDSCIETRSQLIRIGSKPIAGFSIADSCVNNVIQFTDTSHAVGTINNWYWDLDNAGQTAVIQNPFSTYSSYGLKNIKLLVKSLEGCVSDTLYKTIRIKARPVADFGFIDSVCLGTANTFTDNSFLPDGPVSNWFWTIDGNAQPQNQAAISYTFLTPGAHTVQLISSGAGGTNSNCQSNTKIKNVFIADKPRAAIKASFPCETQQVQLKDSSYSTDGIAVTGWWWDLGNGQFSSVQHPFVNYSTAGIKTIRLVVYNARGCASDTLTWTLNVAAKPTAKFGISDALCNNSNLQLTDSSTTTTGNINTWSWTQNGIVFSTQQNPSQNFNPGVNTVGLTVTSSAGCKADTVFKTFSIKTKPAIAMSFNDACKFANVNFSATETSSIGINSWHWNFGDGNNATGSPAMHAYLQNNNYTVKLYAISNEGCYSDTLSRTIHIYGTNAFAGNDTFAAIMQPLQLNATGGTSYEWSPAAGLNATNIANPIATIPSDRSYYLKAFTPEGCESFDTINIKIYKGPEIYLPNAFTPNGDGLNDVLRGLPVGLKEFRYLKIFNRWGQELFSSADYRRGWDGKWKGVPQEQGVYVVIARGLDMNGKMLDKKATVMLIR
ncbi:MAG: hypothetical protein JWQ27_1038 [Ferruginibacter sp.]|nr:hypothetical protein [Ferruginibacter sp.]